MFALDVNNDVWVQQREVLEQALSTNPNTQKALRKLIEKVLQEARQQVVASTKGALDSDPRGAAQGIRRVTYKKILGANLNILNMRKKAGQPTTYEPPRKLDRNPHQRGGNRVPRSYRTNQIMHYGPHDRQWILRIINSGTFHGDRMAGSRGGALGGNRGSIAARNFFRGAGERALMQAADNLATMIDTELEKMLNKKQKDI